MPDYLAEEAEDEEFADGHAGLSDQMICRIIAAGES